MTAQAHSLANNRDTIVAIATAQGRGGIGIVRLSGTDLDPFIQGILGANKNLQSRQATYSSFIDDSGDVLTKGWRFISPGPIASLGRQY